MKKRTNLKTINLVCYLDSNSEVLAKIHCLPYYRYAFIRHDKDYNEDGSSKKAHYHVLICMRKAVNINTIASLFMIAPNLIDTIGDAVSSYRYLTHLDNPEKYQYTSQNIISFGTWSAQMETYTLQDLIREMKTYISSSLSDNLAPSFLIFVERCLNIGYEDLLRKNYFILKDLFLMSLSDLHH